ncbi:hypothetical protein [Streptosporangium saharense]|uniref:hypothetical protein n=1 Tax=Streptosporangium saharense TaxID=1706840 RepID=UPI00331C1227
MTEAGLLLARATREALVMGPFREPAQLDRLLATCPAPGVRLRVLCTHPVPRGWAVAPPPATEIRVIDIAYPWLTVIDRKTALIAAGEPRTTSVPAIVAALTGQFARRWEHAAEQAPPLSDEVTEEQRTILTCLAEGLDDVETAVRVGVTSDQVAHHIAVLMGRAGARNRFELGIHSIKRRWI